MLGIFFYIHPYFWPKGAIPKDPDADWSGFGFGPYVWTIRTYLELSRAGFHCQLTSTVPEEGILLAHRECLSAIDGFFKERVISNKKLFVVDISADLQLYQQANLHIVQNMQQERFYSECFYMRHWPQPALIKRNLNRGDKFENVVFFGNRKNLIPELKAPEWRNELIRLNLNWLEKDQRFDHLDINSYSEKSNWSNYSDVDAVVAIRGFTSKNQYSFDHKPASKLFNAWIAGVPAILGKESAYVYERKSEFDYLEVNSIEECIVCLKLLKNDIGLRRKMLANGFERAKEVSANSTVLKWIDLLENVIIPKYNSWTRMSRVAQRVSIYSKCVRHQYERFKKALSVYP